MIDETFLFVSLVLFGLHVRTALQYKDKFTINNLFYCCNIQLFTHRLINSFLCSPKNMVNLV